MRQGEALAIIIKRLEKLIKEHNPMLIEIKKLSDTAILPFHGSELAAGYDLYSDNDTLIPIDPHETIKISTGLSMAIPNGYFGAIFARSGLATKEGLRPANCTGVIDADYRGPIIVALHNDSDEIKYVEPHSRIAQLIILPHMYVEFEEVEELDSTERGECGFCSTGIQ